MPFCAFHYLLQTESVPAVQFLVRNNFYVLIDDHSEDPTVQNNPTQWVQYYVQMMTDITADVPSRNRVMIDILNEPDHAGYNWAQVTQQARQVKGLEARVKSSTME